MDEAVLNSEPTAHFFFLFCSLPKGTMISTPPKKVDWNLETSIVCIFMLVTTPRRTSSIVNRLFFFTSSSFSSFSSSSSSCPFSSLLSVKVSNGPNSAYYMPPSPCTKSSWSGVEPVSDLRPFKHAPRSGSLYPNLTTHKVTR